MAPGREKPSSSRVFVGGIARESDSDSVRRLLSPFGQVGQVDLIRDRVSGRHRRFAFATFSGEGAVQAAEEACARRQLVLDGKEVEANHD